MDHHSWRARPPPIIQGNNTICPTCSISHFPFCPPRPSFNVNPNRFIQSHNNDCYFSEKAQFDHRPYYHHAPTDNLHPNDGFGDRLPWHRNPNISSYDHDSVGFKRTRADDSGLFTSGNRVNNYSNFVSEDERRLKILIRDHGSISGSSPQVSYENNGYMQDETILRRNFTNVDGGEHGKIEELPSKLNSNVEMYEFQYPNIDYFERGASSHLKSGFNLYKYREEKGFGVGQQYMHTNGNGNGNEELAHSQYGQVENSVLNYSRRDGNISQTVGHFTNIDQAQQSQDEVAPYREGGIQYNSHMSDGYLSVPKMGDKKLPSVGSQSVHYPHSQSPDDSFQNQNIQRIHPSDSLSMNEPHYSHRTNWHGMQGSMNEQRSNFPMVNQNFDNQLPHSYIVQHLVQPNHDTRQSFRVNVLSEDDVSSPYGRQNLNKGGYQPIFSGANAGPTQASRLFDVHPPLPASPPPPLPVEPPGHPYLKPFASSSPPKTSSSLFPISVSSSTDVRSSYPSVAEAHSLAQTYYTDKPHRHTSTGLSTEGFEARQALSTKYSGEIHTFPLRQIAPDKPKIVDASQIFKQPHRATRPDHIVIILRGLPGSGKSYLAKILRDLEVENGGDAPRIHSMDDYFMIEVEKVEDSEFIKTSGTIRGKKAVMKKVMEYCYEPEMEEAYRSSMLKAFKKTLDEGVFSFIIVDDRNLRVADFAQFWAIAKRTGFEVYLLEATYKDPAGCAARNVHGFTQDDIQKMAGQWEEAPLLYLKLDIKPLLRRDDLEESGIQEVDMDVEDGDPTGGLAGSEERIAQNLVVPLVEDSEANGPSKDGERWDAGGHPKQVNELRRSKWSDDSEEGDSQRTESSKRNSSALSGLINAYSKEGKSVCWGDKIGDMGFSIGAARKSNVLSLVIGPGAGYNLKSNPLPEQDNQPVAGKTVEPKRQNLFQQQLRAERESFKAIFDKRRQRIGGFGTEEE